MTATASLFCAPWRLPADEAVDCAGYRHRLRPEVTAARARYRQPVLLCGMKC
jgi:hypothetical protein